ncbi:MAG: CHAD domain-containing protein [Pyrinomonadaceae bacterium]
MAKATEIPGIDCDAMAADGIRLVLTGRSEEMCALREKALEWGDPEGVHDMRVASRRLRSALRDFMPYLRKRRLETALGEIKTLADALGQVRDEDVAIIALERVIEKAPTEVVPGIEEFVELRRAKRDRARKELVQIVSESRIAALRSEFTSALVNAVKAPLRKESAEQNARDPVGVTYREVARATILERLKELEKLSYSLYQPLTVKPLHEMRIAAKRLRYAIELFEQCWGKPIAVFAGKVAALQSSLGELHDCDLWIDNFGEILATARKRPRKTKDAVSSHRETALVWLLTHFVKLRTKHFRNALARWSDWEANSLSAELRRKTVVRRAAPATPRPPRN